MPRVAKTDSLDTVPKRAPRRTVARAPRKTAAKAEGSTRPVRAAVRVNEEGAPVRRKAPTRLTETTPALAARPKAIGQNKNAIFVSGSLFAVGLIATLLIGYSDEGQINPAAVITEQNARAAAGEGSSGDASDTVIPVQNTAAAAASYAESGLVPAGAAARPEPAPAVEPVATTTASSMTEGTEAATTTEATTADGTENESPVDAATDTDEAAVLELSQ